MRRVRILGSQVMVRILESQKWRDWKLETWLGARDGAYPARILKG
jgi:hypothetical protein